MKDESVFRLYASLIMAGADVSLQGTGAPGFAGKTALDLARARQQQEVVALLEERLRAD